MSESKEFIKRIKNKQYDNNYELFEIALNKLKLENKIKDLEKTLNDMNLKIIVQGNLVYLQEERLQ